MPQSPAVGENGLVTGYASLFGAPDRNGDVVMPGAFRETLRKRPVREVKFLFQHDANEPIGVWIDLHEDEKGLRVIGKLIAGVNRAREAFALIRAGAIDGLSIGFKTKTARRVTQNKQRQLLSLDLWEISLVTFPMLSGARLAALDEAEASQRLLRNLQQANKFLTATH
jgi:HK97 family phage prohead protease